MQTEIKKAQTKKRPHTPHGVEALNKGKTRSSDMPPKKMKPQNAGEMYKKPSLEGGLRGKNAKDMSSGQSLPKKGDKSPGCDNFRTYGGVEQPAQYSNGAGSKRTKFVT